MFKAYFNMISEYKPLWEFGVLTLIVDANGDFALRF
jgi:hypothetical protein